MLLDHRIVLVTDGVLFSVGCRAGGAEGSRYGRLSSPMSASVGFADTLAPPLSRRREVDSSESDVYNDGVRCIAISHPLVRGARSRITLKGPTK